MESVLIVTVRYWPNVMTLLFHFKHLWLGTEQEMVGPEEATSSHQKCMTEIAEGITNKRGPKGSPFEANKYYLVEI